MTVSIVLADDHSILRQGVRALLEAQEDLKVVGEAGDGIEALQMTERLRPDILVIDLQIPGLNGLEVIRQVRQLKNNTRIVVLTMYQSEAYVLETLRHGAMAYVSKGADSSELILAIQEAMRDHHYFSQVLSRHGGEVNPVEVNIDLLDPYDTLTNRERQVFQLTAEGLSNAEIARRLVISPRTVEIHRAKMMHKLGLNSHSDLVRYAIRMGILPLE